MHSRRGFRGSLLQWGLCLLTTRDTAFSKPHIVLCGGILVQCLASSLPAVLSLQHLPGKHLPLGNGHLGRPQIAVLVSGRNRGAAIELGVRNRTGQGGGALAELEGEMGG